MKLIICEKPLQAQEYVKVLTKYTNSQFKREEGFFSSSDKTLIVSYAIGHLFELSNPEIYNEKYKSWNVEDLPIIPDNFKLSLSDGKAKQFKILQKLIKESSIIYNATDGAREGELIFRYILQGSGVNQDSKIIKRIWVTDYKYETIKKAYENAKDQKEYNNLYLSAKARSESDWLIGINATRILTVASKSNATLTLGRIQTAILNLIVNRYLKNKNFVVTKLFTPAIILEYNDLELNLNLNYENLIEAKTVLEKTNKIYTPDINQESVEIKQPVLFSLVDLQIFCNKKFNFNATKTLEIAQKLYESKLISYPRTDSNYLTEALKNETVNNLNFLKENYLIDFNKDIDKSKDFINDPKNHFIFDDKKTSDHYAIVPLEHASSDLSKLDEEEINVFMEIIKRFLQCFMNKIKVDQTKIKINITNDLFYFKNFKNITYKGYSLLEDRNEENDNENEYLNIDISQLKNKQLEIKTKRIKEGKTSPPQLFTEATLLAAMKNPLAHENISDNREAVKTLGTPATFNQYLPILLKRNYVINQKKFIVPTNLGESIILNLKDTKLNSISLTAEIEYQLNNISNGTLSYDKYMLAIHKYTKEITEQIKGIAIDVGTNVQIKDKKEALGCPCCKNGKLYLAQSKKNLYCSNYKTEEPCNFILYINIAGKKLTEKNIKDLILKKETSVLEFKNKTGHSYKAKIKLSTEFKTELEFIN